MISYFRHIKSNFFKLGIHKTIGYKKLMEIFQTNDWTKVGYGTEHVVYYSSNIVPSTGNTMPVRNSISKKLIIIDLQAVFIPNPITYYRFFRFLESNPPLTTTERKIKERDQIIEELL